MIGSATRSKRWHALTLGIFALAVFASRLPFVASGYGDDPDAWRMANAARHLASTGVYQASRLPGYPLPETIYALLWSSGARAIVFNIFTAAMSALCSAVFALHLRRIGAPHAFWGAAALAFTPVFYINSTNSMDYVWSLTFIVLACHFALASRGVLSGICLGLAIASRITAGAMALPLCLLLVPGSGNSRKKMAHFLAVLVLVGAVAYIPVLSRYGASAFQFVDAPKNWARALYLASVGVWGLSGCLALLLLLGAVLWRGAHARADSNAPLVETAWIVGILLYAVAFLRLPQESGYLMPVIPFAILLLNRWASPRAFRWFCAALVLSPFVLHLDKDGVYWRGPVLRDHERRVETIDLVNRWINAGDESPPRTVVVTGYYLPVIEAFLDPDTPGNVLYVGLLDAPALQRFLDDGHTVYYLQQVREYNLRVHGLDLAAAGLPVWGDSSMFHDRQGQRTNDSHE